MDILRRETEKCEAPQGFQITHALSGGAGGGFGSLLMLKLKDNFPDLLRACFSVYPSFNRSDVGPAEPYNAALSLHHLIENADINVVFGNDKLYQISHAILKQKEPKFADLNWILSMGLLLGLSFFFSFFIFLNQPFLESLPRSVFSVLRTIISAKWS